MTLKVCDSQELLFTHSVHTSLRGSSMYGVCTEYFVCNYMHVLLGLLLLLEMHEYAAGPQPHPVTGIWLSLSHCVAFALDIFPSVAGPYM